METRGGDRVEGEDLRKGRKGTARIMAGQNHGDFTGKGCADPVSTSYSSSTFFEKYSRDAVERVLTASGCGLADLAVPCLAVSPLQSRHQLGERGAG